jgi:hypothetical protein
MDLLGASISKLADTRVNLDRSHRKKKEETSKSVLILIFFPNQKNQNQYDYTRVYFPNYM